jgi:hemolysin III
MTKLSRERRQTRGEEIANAISHGVGFVIALIGTPLLVIGAVQRGTAADIVGAAVFGGAMAALYLASTLYHAVESPRAKRMLRVADHCAIFLLIAGTYTPFTLGVLRGAWGWSLLGVVWGLAALGILLKVFAGLKWEKASVALYVGMGWLAVVAAKPLFTGLEPWGVFWLVAGGLAYTLGVFFYRRDHVRYAHFVWHLFVLAGTLCHFVAVWQFAVV